MPFFKIAIPKEADISICSNVNTDEITYAKLLSNKRIVFANLCVFFAVFQFTFIDPLLANYLHTTFNISYEDSGYFFFTLATGYTITCFFVHFPVK